MENVNEKINIDNEWSRNLTPKQIWRFHRDAIIYAALTGNRIKMSQRVVANVFDLPYSRIAAIKKNMDKKYLTEQET